MIAWLQRCVITGFFLIAVSARAVLITPTTFTWSTGSDPAVTSVFETAGNWTSEGGGAPTTGSALVFGSSGVSSVAISANFAADSLTLTGAFPAYVFSSTTLPAPQLRLAAGGLTIGSGGATPVTFQAGMQIGLAANQTWNVGAGNLVVAAHVFEAGTSSRLTKAGSGTLTLSGTNAYAGGTTFNAGVTSISADANLGFTPATPTAGSLTFNGGSLSTTASFTLNSNRGISLLAGGGMISPAPSTTLTYGGVIDGTGPLIKSGGGALTLSGTNTFTGGLSVNAGQISVSADANLGASTGAVTLNSGVLISTATFPISTTRSITLAGSGGGLSAAGGTVLAFGGVISGTGPLTIYNAGTVALSGVNTFTGGVVFNTGTLSVAQDANLGAYPGSPTAGNITFNGGTLSSTADLTVGANRGIAINAGGGAFAVATGTALKIDGIVAGTGPIVKAGNGVLELGGANTFSGALSIDSGGTLRASHASALGTTAGATNVTSGGALELNGVSVGSEPVTLAGFGLSSTGALTSSGAASLAGNITLAANTGIGVSDTLTLSGTIGESGGARSLTKVGSGTLILTGSSTYTGSTAVSGGTLRLGAANVLPAGTTVTVGGGAALNVQASQTIATLNTGNTSSLTLGAGTLTLTNGGAIQSGSSGAGGFTFGDGTTRNFSVSGNPLGHTGGTTILAGATLSIGGGSDSGDISGNITNNGTINYSHLSSSDYATFSGVISGPGDFVKSFASSVEISFNQLYTGKTSLNGGSVYINSDAKLGAVPEAATPGKLTFNGGTLVTTTTMTLNANRGILLEAGGGKLSPGSETTFTYGGIIAGTGPFSKVGAGDLVLTGGNTYTGSTIVNRGTLRLGANEVLPSGTAIQLIAVLGGAARLEADGRTQTVGNLTFGGAGSVSSSTPTITLVAGTLNLNGDLTFASNGNPTASAGIFGGSVNLGSSPRTFTINDSTGSTAEFAISSNLTGTNSLTKSGSGTLVLTGAASHTGGTTISGGTLQVGDGGTTGNLTGAITISSGTLAFNRSDAVTIATNLGGGGGLQQMGTGTLTLTGSNNYNGGTTISSGALSLGNGGSSGSINGSVSNDGTLIFNRSDSITFNGTISGNGGIIKRGTGTVVLNANNSSFSGPVVIENGILAVPSLYGIDYNSSLGDGLGGDGRISIVSGTPGATLRYSGSNYTATNRPIDLAGTTGDATLDVGGSGSVEFTANLIASGAGSKTLTLSGSSNGTGTFSGIISDNSPTNTTTVRKTGFGTWYLFGANTYTGSTFVNGGKLTLGSNDTLPGGRDITVNDTNGGSTTLNVANTRQSIGSLIFGGIGASGFASNQVLLGSSGTLFLSGDLTYNATNNPQGATLSAYDVFDGGYPYGGTLDLNEGTRNFNIGNSASTDRELTIYSDISDGGIMKLGSGTLVLAASGNFSGGTTVSAGTLLLGGSGYMDGSSVGGGPIGTGSLTLQSGTILGAANLHNAYGSSDSDVQIYNPVSLANNVTLGVSDSQGGRSLELAGAVTVADLATTVHLKGDSGVQISGALNGAAPATALTFDSGASAPRGLIFLTGSLGSNLASVTADHSAVIFGSAATLTNTAAVKVVNQGYVSVGVGSLSDVPTAAALLARISPADKTAFAGTFGFDSDVDRLPRPYNFSAPIDFSGFGAGFTIGSISEAILSGTITPPSTGYAFGNGGGALVVRSNLTDVGGSKSTTVTSSGAIPDNALLVIFRGNNSYTGNFSVTNSLAILDSASALPAGRMISLGTNGYVGYTEPFALSQAPTVASFLNRISAYTASSVIGFDSSGSIDAHLGNESSWPGSRIESGPIDLSAFGRIYLGTTSGASLTGRIQAPNQSGADRTLSLIGAGGDLTVSSPLAAGDVTRVEVGSDSHILGDGGVELLGASTYTGGTTLLSGNLALADNTLLNANGSIRSGPLGTGPLTVPASAVEPVLRELSDAYGLTLHNLISIGRKLKIGNFSFDDFGVLSILGEGYSEYNGIVLKGAISDHGGSAGSLDLWGDTVLSGSSSYSGGTFLNYGRLTLGSDTALGTGALTLQPIEGEGSSISLAVANGSRVIANNLVVNMFSDDYLPIYGHGSLTINGAVQLNSSVAFSPTSGPLFLNGDITGSGRLTVEAFQSVFLSGTNSYSGGTRAGYGNIIFTNTGSLPGSSSLTSYNDGYIGIGFVPGNIQNDFLSKFNKSNTTGAIGFDGPLTDPANTFNGTINLGDPDGAGPATGFQSSVRLGSATRAILSATATITPQGDVYRFGGGGGLLEVNSSLVDGTSPRSLLVQSDSRTPLTLRLGGTNTYSGSSGTEVHSSAVIFKSGSMPATGSLLMSGMGYIGTEDAGPTGAQSLIGRFSNYAHSGTIGFDSFTGTYAVGGTLDLSGLNSGANVYLGTATSATIGVTAITLPIGQTEYRFAGYKGGQLTVTTPLGGANSVAIGERYSPVTHRSPIDFNGPLSSVTLSGNNTYTGGTKLSAGRLMFGSNTALGTGTLTVNSDYSSLYDYDVYYDAPVLAAANSGLTLPNALAVHSNLILGGSNAFTLAGAISGYAEIYKTGNFAVTLSGDNSSFSGGFYIAQGSINVAHPNALGSGPLRMGTAMAPSVAFSVSATVNGLFGDNASDLITVGNGTTLTVYQSDDSHYDGQFASTGGALVFQGYGSKLRLNGDSSGYVGTTLISGATVVAGHNNAFGPSTNVVTLHGGVLAVDAGVTVANSLALEDGALGGTGTFKPSGTLNIGGDGEHQVVLAPGLSVGTLSFDGSLLGVSNTLNLGPGGGFNWEIRDAANSATGWDQIVVQGTVNISATNLAPFDFKIISLGSDGEGGLALNFDGTKPGSWTVLSATSITGFTGSAQFAIDTCNFENSFSSGLKGFNFSLGGSPGNMSLVLNFDPTVVPEPSTYALLVLGLGVVGWTIRRRRV